MNTGNQSIPNITATKLTLPDRQKVRYFLLRNNTTSSMWIGTGNTITDSSTNACVLPASKDHVFAFGMSTEIWVYQNSGSALRIDWLLQV